MKHKYRMGTGTMHDRVRRRLLCWGGALAASLLLAPLGAADAAREAKRLSGERILGFYNLHTGERLRTIYWAEGQYLNEHLGEIDRVLRDHRTGEVWPIHTQLLDLLHALQKKIDTHEPFHVISGYRSPKTNAMLHQRSRGVAKRSLHMVGKAIDIRLPGRDLKGLRKVAWSLQRGGVGYYPSSNFIHVDVGRVRAWG
jgi:uncharacterized protein YcbK (DUF882 family)